MACSSVGKPRASGDDPMTAATSVTDTVVNPARAGMILVAVRAAARRMRKPRASGDDPRSEESSCAAHQ